MPGPEYIYLLFVMVLFGLGLYALGRGLAWLLNRRSTTRRTIR